LQIQQVGEHQSGRTGSNNSDLSAYSLIHWRESF
jgi:hypothetical protein